MGTYNVIKSPEPQQFTEDLFSNRGSYTWDGNLCLCTTCRALTIPDQTIPRLSRGNPGSRSHSRTEQRVLDGEDTSDSYWNAFFSHSIEANIKETIEHLNNTSCWQKVVAGLEHHTDAVFHYASQLI
jgi:hypothetical protein